MRMSENKSSKKTTWEKLKEEANQKMTEKESTAQKEITEEETTPAQITHPSYADLEEKLQNTEMQLEEAKGQLIQHKEKDSYRLAEIENIQQRAKRDVENAYKYSLEHIIKELLLVMDSLESALASITDTETDSTLKGVQLTRQNLQKVFEKNNVLPIEPAVGKPFDAHYHQAMLTEENTELAPNTILKVLQKGYLLNNRLLRPALVVVSKAVEENI
jgi:molecular chaperone GrpE